MLNMKESDVSFNALSNDDYQWVSCSLIKQATDCLLSPAFTILNQGKLFSKYFR